eukprot:TRINITY_DN1507_c0_g1_i37.p1 TRINITY_DN1507_c0_g1~~TRINITY_DN1507_c0_g1_i37.p1  ORF type:complete len:143 (-),score=31.02 TRINITY_DN1507_c0_g1_i37:232-660(-)
MIPDSLQKAIEVPVIESRDGAVVGNAGNNVELLDADLINLVEDVDGGDVGTVTLNGVDELIGGVVTLDADIGVDDFVLAHDGPDGLVVKVGQLVGGGDSDATTLLLDDLDVGRRRVKTDAEALKLTLDDELVLKGLGGVEHD